MKLILSPRFGNFEYTLTYLEIFHILIYVASSAVFFIYFELPYSRVSWTNKRNSRYVELDILPKEGHFRVEPFRRNRWLTRLCVRAPLVLWKRQYQEMYRSRWPESAEMAESLLALLLELAGNSVGTRAN